jgi:hypothetical protein
VKVPSVGGARRPCVWFSVAAVPHIPEQTEALPEKLTLAHLAGKLVHKNPPLVPILSQAVPLQNLPPYSVTIHFNIIIRSWGICGGQSGNEDGVLRVVLVPLPILIPPTAPYSLINTPPDATQSRY